MTPPTAPRPEPGRRRLAAAAIACGVAVAWAGAHLFADSPASRARIRARAERLLADRLGPAEVGPARVDWLFRAELGALAVPASRPGAEALLRVERVVVRPRIASLLRGRIEPGTVTLEGVRVVPGPGAVELRRAWERLRSRPAGSGPGAAAALPDLHLRRLEVVLGAEGERSPAVGPLDVDVALDRDAEGTRLRVRLGLPGGGGGTLELRRGAAGAAIVAELEASLPGDLPRALAARLPADLTVDRLKARFDARGGPDLRSGTGALHAEARGVRASGPRVGPEPLGPFAARLDGAIGWDAAARRATLDAGRIELGHSFQVAASIHGTAEWGAGPHVALELRGDDVPWSSLLSALPPDLQPPESAPRVDGPLSGRLAVSGPPALPSDWTVEAELDLDAMRRAARSGPPGPLAAPFHWRPLDPPPDEAPRDILVGPANPSFVPLPDLPPHLVRAVTASEDAGFFAHRGFDFQEIARALTDARGGRVRGASTITQQLAKNLFLSSDRTLARKIREALATVELEAAMPKSRLLEIYLNIAEWGPGVYGVGEASRYWFGKDARDLSPKESAFLASVIPSPRRFAARLRRGGVSPWWQDRIADILGKMWIQGQLSDEELSLALDAPLALAIGPARGPGSGEVSEPGTAADPEEPSARPGDPPATQPPR